LLTYDLPRDAVVVEQPRLRTAWAPLLASAGQTSRGLARQSARERVPQGPGRPPARV